MIAIIGCAVVVYGQNLGGLIALHACLTVTREVIMVTQKEKQFISFLVVCLIVGLFVVGAVPGAESANVIKNGSFEQAAGEKPANWSTDTWGGEASFEYASIGKTGSRSVMVASESGADAGWTQTVKVKPNYKYRLSAWIKTEGLERKGGRGALLNIHNIQNVRTKSVTGTSDWTKVQAEFEASTDSIQINCLFGGWGNATGKAWFDDVTLEELEKIVHVARTVEAKVNINVGEVSADAISPYIYGQFIEHLGRCIYGGIWAEMLEDRKFYFPVPAKGDIWRLTGAQARVLAASPWKVIGPAEAVTMVKENVYVGRHSPQINLTGYMKVGGIYQEELGLVAGKKYTGRIILAGDSKAGPVKVSLVWGPGDDDRDTVTIKRLSRSDKKTSLSFTSKASTDNGRLEIVGLGKGTFTIGTVSLMPADNVEGFRADTLELLKKLNSPVYRWPGGNFVSGYDWRDGLGERDKRPTRTNPAWTGIETNDMGLDEFVRLCELIGTEPMIAVNTGFMDAYSAAAEVEYANGSAKTPMGKWRAQNGHSKPYGVKWWCVGNEMFGRWQLGYMQLNHYVLKHNWVEEKMRQVDPTIKTIGVGEAGNWSEGMLKSCAENMDLISEHFYCQERGDLIEHVRQIPNQVKRIADAHRKYRSTLPSLEGKDIRVSLDEWNYWYGPHPYGELGTRYFLKDALGIAAGLHEYFRNSDIYFMANYAQTVNVIGCIKTTKTAAGFATTALPLMLYREHFGTLPVSVGEMEGPLDISAALTEDKKALTVAIVNPTQDTYKLDLNLTGPAPQGKAETWIITGDNPRAYNNPGETPNVAITEADDTDISQTVAIKPLSISLYKVSVK